VSLVGVPGEVPLSSDVFGYAAPGYATCAPSHTGPLPASASPPLLLPALLRRAPLLPHLGWIVVGLGDSVAAVVGARYGRYRWPAAAAERTVEGTPPSPTSPHTHNTCHTHALLHSIACRWWHGVGRVGGDAGGDGRGGLPGPHVPRPAPGAPRALLVDQRNRHRAIVAGPGTVCTCFRVRNAGTLTHASPLPPRQAAPVALTLFATALMEAHTGENDNLVLPLYACAVYTAATRVQLVTAGALGYQ